MNDPCENSYFRKKQSVMVSLQLSGTIFWKLKKTREKGGFLIERVMNMQHKKPATILKYTDKKAFSRTVNCGAFEGISLYKRVIRNNYKLLKTISQMKLNSELFRFDNALLVVQTFTK